MPNRRSFGSVYRRKRPDGSEMDGYYIRWSDAGGRRRKRFGGLTKDAAETTLLEIRRAVLRERLLGEPQVEDISLSAWLDRVPKIMRARKQAPRTIANRRAAMKRLRSKFGRRPAVKITQADIQAHIDALSLAGMKNSTLRTEVGTISVVFAMAVAARVALVNPARGVKVGRVVHKAVSWLRADELMRVLVAMPRSIRSCVVLQAELGLRPGEARALAWEDLDDRFEVLTVRRTDGSDTTKSGRERRIPSSQLAIDTLRHLWGRRHVRSLAGLTPVFPDITGSNYNREFRAAADRIGRTTLVPHDLRHNWIAHLVRTPGVDLESARRMAGHESLTTTQKYLRAIPDDEAFDAMHARDTMQSGGHDSLLATP